MAEAPEKIGIVRELIHSETYGGTDIVLSREWYSPPDGEVESGDASYTRTDLYEEAVRQRDALLEACKRAVDCMKDRPGPYGGTLARCRQAIAACDSPPLARGDVKTGKVITSAELIASTDTPEIRGAVAPEGGGRHT